MTASATIPFVKMNGLGNEIVVVDLRARARSSGCGCKCQLTGLRGSIS
jgi:hypothetical protein